MSTIRAMYEKDPGFPATDQHPNAVRYPIIAGVYRFADAIGGQPTQAEVDALLKPVPQNTDALATRQKAAALEQLERAIGTGDTTAALRIVHTLLQEK